jgi:hypothetical protein
LTSKRVRRFCTICQRIRIDTFCGTRCRKCYASLNNRRFWKNNRKYCVKKQQEYRKRSYVIEKDIKLRNSSGYKAERKEYYQNNKDKIMKKFNYRHRVGKANSKARGRSWTISKKLHRVLLNKNCHYCNKSLLNETGAALDRIDNNKGYHKDNVLPCCGACNKIRNTNLTVKEMEVAMKAVLQYRKLNEKD